MTIGIIYLQFEHGLKIIISHLSNQWHQEICFLPVENIDRADIAF
ncbi:hypothetical protein V4S68_05555, partial [Citrobacter freundii]